MARTEFSDALRGVYRDIDGSTAMNRPSTIKRSTRWRSFRSSRRSSHASVFFKPFILLAVIGFVLGLQAFGKFAVSRARRIGSGHVGNGARLSDRGFGHDFPGLHYYHNAPPGYDVVEFDSLAFDKKGKCVPRSLRLTVKGLYYEDTATDRHAGIENFQRSVFGAL